MCDPTAQATSDDFAERQKYKIVKFIADNSPKGNPFRGTVVHAGNFRRDEGENLPPTAPFLHYNGYDKHIAELRDDGCIVGTDPDSQEMLHRKNTGFGEMRLRLTEAGWEYKEDYESRSSS